MYEYPVLDRFSGSNNLDLDFRWVCAVSSVRNRVFQTKTYIKSSALYISQYIFMLSSLGSAGKREEETPEEAEFYAQSIGPLLDKMAAYSSSELWFISRGG